MISAEQAREQLAAVCAVDDWRERRALVNARLSPALTGRPMPAAGAGDWQPEADEIATLDELAPEQLAAVLRAVSPELGDDIARWWTWSADQPYQRGWDRRAYRSPVAADSRAARWSELLELLSHAVAYPRPLDWQADWLLHLPHGASLGPVIAAAITAGGPEGAALQATMLDSLRGEHATSGPCRDAFVAVLGAPDPSGWAEVGRLLVAAQRSEGLRQVIMESVDLAHPEAFAAVLEVAVEHGLARFAATVRALGVWIGEEIEPRSERKVADALQRLRGHLATPPDAEALLQAEPVDVLLGLWSLAVRDAHAAVGVGGELLASPDAGRRLAAARVLADLGLHEAREVLARAADDDDPAVLATVLPAWLPIPGRGQASLPPAAREKLEARLGTVGKVRRVETGLIGQRSVEVGDAAVADLLIRHAPDGPIAPALMTAASADGRGLAARRFADDAAAHRGPLLSLLADRSSYVRSIAGAALAGLSDFDDAEARLIEETLTRKASDVRTMGLDLLRRQSSEGLAATVARLRAGTAEQQRAADELAGRGSHEDALEVPIPAVLRRAVAERTPAQRPEEPSVDWSRFHDGCRLLWTSLRAWLAEHADVEVRTGRDEVVLLANLHWTDARSRDGQMPLPEVVGPWWERTAPQLTDGGLETLLLSRTPRGDRGGWLHEAAHEFIGPVVDELIEQRNAGWLAMSIITSMSKVANRPSWADPMLAMVETLAARLPDDAVEGPREVMEARGRTVEVDRWGRPTGFDDRMPILDLVTTIDTVVGFADLDDARLRRLWEVSRFLDEPEGTIDRWEGPRREVGVEQLHAPQQRTVVVPDQPTRLPSPTKLLVTAFERGIATRADVLDALVLPIPLPGMAWRARRPEHISHLTRLRPDPWAASAEVAGVVAEVRAALLESETTRGDLPTPLSPTARAWRSTHGADELVACLSAIGRRPFARGYAWTDSRESCLSHLVRINQPGPDDAARLGELLAKAKIPERRLVETAVYAPQWAGLLEQHLDWPGLETAVWWVHAHTKDDGWSVEADVREQWASEVSQRTPLESDDLVNGAADVVWFRDVLETIGRERFGAVLAAAKYASSSGGHKRAELFASALLDEVAVTDLVTRMDDKRHQDSVRALGLVPLSGDDDLLARYERLRAFVATGRGAGAQRRASETRAVDIGLDNLARTAGYRDPQRLVWAMEAEAVRDLADGPVRAVHGDLEVALSIDEAGAPLLSVQRGARTLKSVPAASAKVPEIAALKARATHLRTQARRMRASLEAACVLGDPFETDEIVDLLGHPVLAPMLRDVVLVDGEGFVGLPDTSGALTSADGSARRPVGAVRVAHPVDLLASGEWPALQHLVMGEQRRQPFKQLFRELYVLTDTELEDAGRRSRRYAGHQVEGGRAAGIFTSRGWVSDREQGFSRTYHQQRITVWCSTLDGWGSPTEVEDGVLGDITFHPAGRWDPMELVDVPPRLFSEAMRDLDLVVSVAHAGGVDPEASQSSVEMRGRLVEETTQLLGIDNLEVGGHHVRIRGRLAQYSVHLGSGQVHLLPGRAVCIVPVSAQQRGRIFLPFADDDPRTAEIVAKVVLLARDDKIKDPTILEQLVR